MANTLNTKPEDNLGEKDIFGYRRDVHPNGSLVSSEVAVLSLGGQQITLVQNLQASYQQRAEPRYEAGTSNMYWIAGHPLGSVTIGRLVGKDAALMLTSAAAGGSCAMKTLQLSFDGGGHECHAHLATRLKFSGIVVNQVSVSYAAGSLEVSENITMQVSHVAEVLTLTPK